MADEPNFGSFSGSGLVAGTEFEYLDVNSEGWYLVDGSLDNSQRWACGSRCEHRRPEDFFQTASGSAVGYIVGTMYPDLSGANTDHIILVDRELGQVEIPIKQIKSIHANATGSQDPLIVATAQGRRYSGSSKVSPLYVGSSHNTYLIDGTTTILLETSRDLVLEPLSR